MIWNSFPEATRKFIAQFIYISRTDPHDTEIGFEGLADPNWSV